MQSQWITKNLLIIVLAVVLALFVFRDIGNSKNSLLLNTQAAETISLSTEVDWFLSSLGVFSTVLLVIIGYAVINSFNQQKQIDEDMREIRKMKEEARTKLIEINNIAKGISSVEMTVNSRNHKKIYG